MTNCVKSTDAIMNLDIAESLITQAISLCKNHDRHMLTIIWHGGEPLLWGIENYRYIFALTKQLAEGICVRQCLQTNLSLIDEEYIELFKKYNVKIGFSIDGPKEINDKYRKKKDGSGSHDTIIQNLYKCREARLNVGVIIVASSAFKGRIPELYRFICKHRLNFKFNPLFMAGEASKCNDLSLTPLEYAQMSNELFDLWFFDKEHHIKESTFEDIASAFLTKTKKTKGCMFSKNCQDNFLAISPRGDVFPCGRFCDTDTTHSYGNINEEALEDILNRRKESSQYKRAEFISKSGCRDCSFFDICHGGCLHDGYLNGGNFESKTFLCAAYKLIFGHIRNRVQNYLVPYYNSN